MSLLFKTTLKYKSPLKLILFFILQKDLCELTFQTCHVVWFWLTRLESELYENI